MKSLSKFSALPGKDKTILLSATLLLPFVDLALRIYGFKKTYQFLSRNFDSVNNSSLSHSDQYSLVHSTIFLVGIAGNRSPYKTTCLRQSLVSWWLLQRKGIATTLKIGVANETNDFAAHAWIELNGTPVVQTEPALKTYAPIYCTGKETPADQTL